MTSKDNKKKGKFGLKKGNSHNTQDARGYACPNRPKSSIMGFLPLIC